MDGNDLTKGAGLRRHAVVTGGAGFLGSHICERLLADGYDVVCVDNFLTGRVENVANLANIGPFRVLRGDITETCSIPGPVDLVMHFASPASPVDYQRFPIETLRVGSLGTLNTLELAREKRARYVLASTSEIYGDPLVHPQSESYWGNVNPVGPRAAYDEAKRFSETLVVNYRKVHRLTGSIVRIFNTYGPRMRENDGRVVPTFIGQALRSEALTVAGTGQQTRSMCYVSDLVEGVMRLAASEYPGPINLGNPREMTVLGIAEVITDSCASSSPIEFVSRPAEDPERRQPDITLATKVLDWSPQVSFVDGVKATITSFSERAFFPMNGTTYS